MKLCLSPRSDCAKVAPAPCLFPCVPGARSADFSHKIKLSQPLPPINPASLPQEERTGFSLLCISRIIHQLGFMLTTGGAVGAREKAVLAHGVCGESAWRNVKSIQFSLCVITEAMLLRQQQAAGVSEPSAVRAFIPANHLCPRLPAPPC